MASQDRTLVYPCRLAGSIILTRARYRSYWAHEYSSTVHIQYRYETLWLQTDLERVWPHLHGFGQVYQYTYMVCLVQEDSKPGASGGTPRVEYQEKARGFVKTTCFTRRGTKTRKIRHVKPRNITFFWVNTHDQYYVPTHYVTKTA